MTDRHGVKSATGMRRNQRPAWREIRKEASYVIGKFVVPVVQQCTLNSGPARRDLVTHCQ
jgi:hypothetical protein